jgi:hypothetical protein
MTLVAAVVTTLLREIDKDGIVAQRIKRLESIETKLRQQPKMKLSRMQDIGGCRAICKDIATLNKLASSLTGVAGSGFEFSLKDNYVDSPKLDGYRGIHVAARYQGSEEEYRNLQIEVQIRTRSQHSWATGIEICQFFQGKRYKTMQKDADPNWLRFFALASTLIAMNEGTALVPNTPTDRAVVLSEMRAIDSKWGVTSALHLWGDRFDRGRAFRSNFYVMDLRSTKPAVLETFGFDDLPQAERKYFDLEQEHDGDITHQVVLVSVEDLDSLANAYPNYILNALPFLALISEASDA